ncbi:MAG: hypothetical protein QG657_4396 [Acidobacteriota bacterium]|nr:hypothetical protein [Acidobacteriota bacterium]
MKQTYNFGACGECRKDSLIVLTDRNKKTGPRFIGRNSNKKEILQIKVDHCLPITGKKCDYLLIDQDENAAHFIELKGHKIKDAFEQLANSIFVISNPEKKYISRKFDRKQAYVVSTQVNPKLTTEIQRAKKSFKENFNTELEVKNNKYERVF